MTEPTCIFSECRKYRYTLWRDADMFGQGVCVFVGLNPSTADETKDDPTIRRCIRFAADWGYRRLCMLNMFAFRATDPSDMMAEFDPIGPENDAILIRVIGEASLAVAAWGVHGTHRGRDEWARQTFVSIGSKLCCLGLTKEGHPRHPLYVRASQMALPLWIKREKFRRAPQPLEAK